MAYSNRDSYQDVDDGMLSDIWIGEDVFPQGREEVRTTCRLTDLVHQRVQLLFHSRILQKKLIS